MFASKVGERYQPRAFIASRADLALAHETPGQINTFYGGPQIEISPEINFQEHYFLDGRQAETRVIERLFHRLFSRQTRVLRFDVPTQNVAEARATNSTTRSARDMAEAHGTNSKRQPFQGAGEEAGRVERSLPRLFAGGAAEKPPLDVVPSPANFAGWGTPIAAQEAARPVILGAPEIQRVAKQVLREMDHQFRARRERTGKTPR